VAERKRNKLRAAGSPRFSTKAIPQPLTKKNPPKLRSLVSRWCLPSDSATGEFFTAKNSFDGRQKLPSGIGLKDVALRSVA
jgi:hypothetical protein